MSIDFASLPERVAIPHEPCSACLPEFKLFCLPAQRIYVAWRDGATDEQRTRAAYDFRLHTGLSVEEAEVLR